MNSMNTNWPSSVQVNTEVDNLGNHKILLKKPEEKKIQELIGIFLGERERVPVDHRACH